MASAEDIARSYWQAEMARDLGRVLGHYASDVEFDMPGVHLSGAEIRSFYEDSFKAFPTLEHTVTRVTGNDKRACLEWLAVVTDVEGNRFSVRGANVVEADGERMTRVAGYYDRTDFEVKAEPDG